MNILVIGGTGTVGSAVVRELVSRNARVHVLTRDAAKAERMAPGVTPVAGDLLDPSTVRSVFAGRDAVFMLNPVSDTETHQGLMGVNGARLARVPRMVYMSVHDVEGALHLPHFGAKLPVELALKASGMQFTILRPNNFFQNDYWFKDVLLQHGVYPQPIGSQGISRVDVRDIAEAAATALTSREHSGETYNLVGPEPLTGSRTAELWGEALGRPIAYAGDNLDAWEQQSLAYLPPWMVFDFRLMYEHFQRHGLHGTTEDLRRQTELIGHPPRRFDDFARETARAWMS